jgi:hypothetical protein
LINSRHSLKTPYQAFRLIIPSFDLKKRDIKPPLNKIKRIDIKIYQKEKKRSSGFEKKTLEISIFLGIWHTSI